MPIHDPPPANRRSITQAILLLVTLAVSLVAIIQLHVFSRKAALRTGLATLAATATEAAGPIANRLQHYETLQHLTGSVLGMAAPPDPSLAGSQNLLRAAALGQDKLMRITLFGPDGHVLWSPYGIHPDRNIIGRNYFLAIRNNGAATAIGATVTGHDTNLPTVHFAAALRADGGTLLGITVIAVAPDQLLGHIPTIIASSPLSRSLLHSDGTVIASQGAPFNIPPALLAEALHRGAATTRLNSPDQPATLVALQRIGTFPLLIALSLDEASFTVPAAQAIWYQDAALAALLATLIASAIAARFWHTARRRLQVQDTELRATAREAAAMRLVTDNIGSIISIWEATPDGGAICQFVSPSLETILGLNTLAILPDQSLPQIYPADQALFRARIAAMLAGIPAPDQDLRAYSTAGALLWFHATTRRIPEPDADSPRRHIIVWHDITASKHAELIAETFRLRADSLAANVPGCLYDCEVTFTDPNHPVTAELKYISQGFADLTGYAPAQFDLPSAFARMPADQQDSHRQDVLHAVLTEGETALEYDLICADGHQVRVRDRTKVVDRSATSARLIGFMADITDEVLLRDRLVEIGRLALLGELAASIAHEINQPLSVIMMRAERLRASKTQLTPAAIIQAGEVIVSMSERAARVVRSIRDFAHQGDVPLATFDPADACGIAITIVEPHLKARQTHITTDFATPRPLAVGHAGHYEQVLVNLIINAFDAYDVAQPGKIGVVEIAIAVAPCGTNTITTVTDHAGGIPAHVLPRLFEAFYTTKGVGVGTGLGLTICQRLLTDMSGTLSVHNTADGACFTITLPQPGTADPTPPPTANAGGNYL